ncbi:Maf family protein [Sphingomonas sp. GCM10030256]|uniref:Maf family protein n=1 Tax=Sphingomonas sp. GCM10030256 TaxID=3273427 RepID=UPI00361BAA26
MDLLLASTSPIRRTLLLNAGVRHEAAAPEVNEAALKAAHPDEHDAGLALLLAQAKALRVSEANPEALALGSDSLVSVDGRRFSKPADKAEASDHLRFFSGKTMTLTSAAVLARGGMAEWRHAEQARLSVRPLSEAFIGEYLDREWPEVGYCVGVFRLEGPGVQLFDRIEGDHFTILGLPLLPLLGALRRFGALQA